MGSYRVGPVSVEWYSFPDGQDGQDQHTVQGLEQKVPVTSAQKREGQAGEQGRDAP